MMWNVKEDQNVFCWNCDHFQRYDNSEEPHKCLGECRRKAPGGQYVGEWGDPAIIAVRWPLIIYSPIFWCSHWEKTREQNLAPLPTELQISAPRQVTQWSFCEFEIDFPDDIDEWQPWNKKAPENVSCWNCDHFQRTAFEPGPRECGGYCRKNPPLPWVRNLSQSNGSSHALSLEYIYGNDLYLIGPYYWCGEWEFATFEVPPVPECSSVDKVLTTYEIMKENKRILEARRAMKIGTTTAKTADKDSSKKKK